MRKGARFLRHWALMICSVRIRYDCEKSIEIREATRNSIGSAMSAKSVEFKHTICFIRERDKEIEERGHYQGDY